MRIFPVNVSNDDAISIAMLVIDLFSSIENSDYPMLKLTFNNNIDVLFVEGGTDAAVIYMRMKQAGEIDEETCKSMISKCLHADQLPSGFKIEFKYDGLNGECDSYTIIRSIPFEHRKAQKEYMKEIEKRCIQKGIKHKVREAQIGFLNWS